MDIFQTLYEIARDICRPIARRYRYARSLPKKFKELKDELPYLWQQRAGLNAEIVRENQHKAPTNVCNVWIAEVGKIEAEVNKIEEQHLVNKRCLKGCFPDVIARVRLSKDVEEMIKSVKELQEKYSKFEAGFLTDLPLTIEMMEEKFRELNKQLTTLCRRRDDIKAKIDRVNLQKAPTRECKGWIEDVDKIEIQVKETEEQHLVNKRCLKGCSPDVIAHARLCEDVEKMIKSVEDLRQNSKFEDGFLIDLPRAKVEKRPLSDLSMEASTKNTFQKIFEHVRHGGTQKIGIWGMGGIGKTTLLKLLNNKPEIANMFQVVIWVTVSQSWSIRSIQDEVADRLSLKVEKDQSNERVAIRLLRELEGKKCLLLLDDVWESMDLNAVGIPIANQNNGCKVVLTTRESKVCNEMKTDVEINVEALPDEEAWKMFESIVGDIAEEIKPIAEKIVPRCGGLPLALKVVGAALRKEKDVSVWRYLLKNYVNVFASLKSPDSSYANVFASLKASYEHLNLRRTTSCTKNHFLYCGLYPEDHEIKKSRLIKYWRAEGLLSSECTLVEAGDEGRALLRDLVDASLLEKCEDDNHVKMHDVIRDFVLHLTSPKRGEKSRHVVRAGESKQEIVLKDKEWEEASRISFMYAKKYSLPEMPNCPKLSTLLLQSPNCWSSPLEAIPESFFKLMPSLGVLDLSNSRIHSLPSSISILESLRALLLKCCHYLDALPYEIIKLKKLEVFEVTDHKMRDLPIEIWELTSLKCLNLKGSAHEGAKRKVKIPVGKISKLSQLERFEISHNEFQVDEESERVVGEELSSLTRLSSFVFEFGSVNNLKQFVEKSKAWRDQIPRKFRFNVESSRSKRYFSKKYKRELYYDGKRHEGSGIVSSAMREVIKRSEHLELGNIRQGLTKLSDLGVGNISGLKACAIWTCDAVETFADEAGLQEDAFVNLQGLFLDDLANLRSFFCCCCCCDISPPMRIKNMQFKDNFKSLRYLYVRKCPLLKQLFSSWGLLSQLLNLELLFIENCTRLGEMISVDDDVDDDEITQLQDWTTLPKLKHLQLENLDEFVSFFSKGNVSRLRWPSLERLFIKKCPKLKIFPFGAHNLPRLWDLTLFDLPELVSLGEKRNDNVNASLTTVCWESLTQIKFQICPKLKIFPFSADSAPNLESIKTEIDEVLKWQDDATKLRFSHLQWS